jgi:predicted dehydrogenase
MWTGVLTMSSYSRRDFFRRGAVGAAGLGLFLNGKWVPYEAAPLPKPASPNDRVNVGFIGFGIRGNILLEAVKTGGQANLVAVSDCYQGHLDRAKERTDGKIDTNFAEYKKLLDRKDIDAFVVAPPDHQHLPIVLDVLSAGKDIYIEKPMTHRVEDGPKMIAAVKRYNRVLQTGSQWISTAQMKTAKEMISSGKLGKVTKIIAQYNRNSSTGAWNYPIPPDLKDGVNFNWKEWLGNAPKVEFSGERVFRYRKYWDYSGGISTDLFVHLITSIHYAMDVQMPKRVVATGGILFRHDGREVPDTLDALFDYGDFHVAMGSTFNSASAGDTGVQILGTDGSLTIQLGGGMKHCDEWKGEGYHYSIDSWPKQMQEAFMHADDHREKSDPGPHPKPEEVPLPAEEDATVLHLLNFLNGVRSHQQANEPVEIGNYAAAAGHMVNLSYRSGKTMVWDEAKLAAKAA